jgi:hypothetical protein
VGKLILTSILAATIVVPAIYARDPSPRRGLKRTMVALALFNAVYVVLLVTVYAQYYVPETW